MKTTLLKKFLLALVALLFVSPVALAQDGQATSAMQSAATALANLPDADVLIYVSPQRIFSDAAPKFMSATQLTKMRSDFADLKKSIGIDPASVEYIVIAMRFHKPAGDLSFVAPDVLAVASGDFSAEGLASMAQLYLQDKARTEKHGSKTITVVKVDPIAAQAEKMPMLKSLVEMGVVPLSGNSLAAGNLPYLQAAIDASEGNGRLNPATLASLMRNPNVLIAATGAPLSSFAKAFGLYGTETTAREGRCDTTFGNFYSAITINGANFSLRGAMNADNPDTAKIISGLLAGLMQQGINSVPDKQAQTILQTIKMTPKENEIVWEADVPASAITELLAERPMQPPVSATVPQKTTTPHRPVRRKKRTRH